MDKILEILETFRCHLKRGEKTMLQYLTENYEQYISTLKKSIAPSDNPLVGDEMCKMVENKLSDIEANTVTRMLHNRRYIGEYQYRDVVVPNGIPAIVPAKLFEQVQARAAANKKAPAKH